MSAWEFAIHPCMILDCATVTGISAALGPNRLRAATVTMVMVVMVLGYS